MANAATEAPASYVLATQFHDTVREILDVLDHEHDYLALELLKYSERIMGNVGAAEAPYAADRRQHHYQIAFSAACGCASACDLVARFRMAPRDKAKRANQLLGTLAALIRPIAEQGMEPRSEAEEAILNEVFGNLESEEPWKDLDGDDDEDDDVAW